MMPAIASMTRTTTLISLTVALALSSGCGAPAAEGSAADSIETGALQQGLSSILKTSTAPTKLSITANSNTDSGTTGLIALEYCNSAGFYVCFIEGIADGATASCTPTASFNPLRCSTDQFSVSYAFPPYSDGLRTTTIGVTINGTSYSVEKFTNAYVKLDCSGCSGSFDNVNCNACWIDSDDHGKCLTMQVTMDSYGTSTCSSSAG